MFKKKGLLQILNSKKGDEYAKLIYEPISARS